MERICPVDGCLNVISPPRTKFCSDDCSKATRARRHREWRRENPENLRLARARTLASMSKMRRERPDYVSVYRRTWLYGITVETYMRMLDEQSWRCLVCEKKITVRTARVDHDHGCCAQVGERGQRSCGDCVRGLLCGRCNTVLGMAQDDTRLLIRAARYLEAAALSGQLPLPLIAQKEQAHV